MYVKGLLLVSPVNDTDTASVSDDNETVTPLCDDGQLLVTSVVVEAGIARWALHTDTVIGEFASSTGGSSGGYEIGVSPSVLLNADGLDITNYSMAGVSLKHAIPLYEQIIVAV